MTMTTTRMMTTKSASEARATAGIVSASCPVCQRKARVHAESVYRGAEIVCSECSAILVIETTAPLALIEADEEDEN